MWFGIMATGATGVYKTVQEQNIEEEEKESIYLFSWVEYIQAGR